MTSAESEQGVAQAILHGIIDFKRDPWPHISESAKSLVRQMLEPDPKLRLTAKQVLGIINTLAILVSLDIHMAGLLLSTLQILFLITKSLIQ